MGGISGLVVEEGDGCSGYVEEVEVKYGGGHKEVLGYQKKELI
jgi:hypothetical protein